MSQDYAVKNLFLPRAVLDYWFSRGEFFRSAAALAGGAVVAQAVPLLACPVITRLYRPEDFGMLALFTSIASILTIMATGRYELAVVLPEKDDDAVNVAALCAVIAFGVSIAAMLVFCVFGAGIARFFGSPGLAKWLYFVPVAVFTTAVLNVFIAWSVRRKMFLALSVNKIYGSSMTSAGKIGLGLSAGGPAGLIGGTLIGQNVAAAMLGWKIWKNAGGRFSAVTFGKIRRLLVRYANFPRFSIPADFLNTLSNEMVVFLLAGFFGDAALGLYAISMRVMGMPIGLIGNSVLDVFKQRASSDYARSGNCRRIYEKTFVHLAVISIIPAAMLFVFAPSLFAFVFGPQWRLAGEYTRILSVLFFFRFISSPLSYVFVIAEKQKYDLVWQMFLMLFTIASILSGVFWGGVKVSLVCFSLSYSALYAVQLFLSYRFSKGRG